jgi:hypothetical protein
MYCYYITYIFYFFYLINLKVSEYIHLLLTHLHNEFNLINWHAFYYAAYYYSKFLYYISNYTPVILGYDIGTTMRLHSVCLYRSTNPISNEYFYNLAYINYIRAMWRTGLLHNYWSTSFYWLTWIPLHTFVLIISTLLVTCKYFGFYYCLYICNELILTWVFRIVYLILNTKIDTLNSEDLYWTFSIPKEYPYKIKTIAAILSFIIVFFTIPGISWSILVFGLPNSYFHWVYILVGVCLLLKIGRWERFNNKIFLQILYCLVICLILLSFL